MLRNRTCRCGGVMTSDYVKTQLWYACMRCDTDEKGHGYGPPRFMRIWAERRKDLNTGTSERGSE